MPYNPFDPPFDQLPDMIPIFPLEGVLLLPRGELPLNIFEPRYLSMVRSALTTHGIIGMIQPQAEDTLFHIGCAGRIVRYEETMDGRYLISLRGLCRFRILKELDIAPEGFRRVKPIWASFEKDMERMGCLDIDRNNLTHLLHDYFDMQGLSLQWELLEQVGDDGLMTTLAMVCPFSTAEKQALLEAPCCKSRAGLFMQILEMALRQSHSGSPLSPH